MLLLFIEDEPQILDPVLNLIKKEHADFDCQVRGFEEAEDVIVSLCPDIIILDLLVGGVSPEPEPAGIETRDFIWSQHFCPIVVYSAEPNRHDENYPAHPFIASIQKGSKSPRLLLNALEAFLPHVEALQEAKEHINKSFAIAMRDVAPYAFDTFADEADRNESIKRSGRRRLSALMDWLELDGMKLASWEQYIFPPVTQDILLGDILKDVGGNQDDPASFRIVLSPSCDLVASGGRTPKIDNVLVARCSSIKDGLSSTSLNGIKSRNLIKNDRLTRTILTPGYLESVIPFPALGNQIPTMSANMKNLEFIRFDDIGSDKPFLRVASIDSPFRELVSWAYLQTACRPGLPDRDFLSWRDEIVVSLET